VAQSALVPTSGTVTLTVDGTVIATKQFLITGYGAKIVISSIKNGKAGIAAAASSGSTVNDNLAKFTILDSAGNQIAVAASSTNLLVKAGTTNNSVTGITGYASGSAVAPVGFAWSCSATKGSAQLVLQYKYDGLNSIYSDPFTANCFGDAYSYTVKTDKTDYNIGDLVTVSVSFKDSAGNPSNDVVSVGTTTKGTVTSGAFSTTTVTDTATGDKTTNGVMTYKYVAGTTEGSFQVSANFPEVNVGGTLVGAGAAQTAAVTVKSASTSVTNAEVLSAIVKLIASINKQIAALQKALTKKK